MSAGVVLSPHGRRLGWTPEMGRINWSHPLGGKLVWATVGPVTTNPKGTIGSVVKASRNGRSRLGPSIVMESASSYVEIRYFEPPRFRTASVRQSTYMIRACMGSYTGSGQHRSYIGGYNWWAVFGTAYDDYGGLEYYEAPDWSYGVVNYSPVPFQDTNPEWRRGAIYTFRNDHATYRTFNVNYLLNTIWGPKGSGDSIHYGTGYEFAYVSQSGSSSPIAVNFSLFFGRIMDPVLSRHYAAVLMTRPALFNGGV